MSRFLSLSHFYCLCGVNLCIMQIEYCYDGMNYMSKLEGKTALITGACGAIGRAVVESLYNDGAHLIITGTNFDRLEEVRTAYSDRCDAIQCNFNDLNAVSCLAQNIEEQFGRKIDILVNNAGVTDDGLLMRMSDDAWNNVLDVNLTATFKLIQSCIRGMIKSKWGRIINISSIVAFTGNPGQANYCASKAGMVGLSKSVALEVASRGITVNCVAPGMIASAMIDKLPEDAQQKMLANIPVGRIGIPEDVANCVSFLASKASSFITGHVLHVNGGMAML